MMVHKLARFLLSAMFVACSSLEPPPPSSWTQLGDDIDGEALYDLYGSSVSLSSDGTIVAIGATANSGNGRKAGHVRVYARANETSSWVKRGDDIDGEAAWDLSGVSVSLSSDGNIVAIGAEENSDNGSVAGHVRVYAWSDESSSWLKRGDDIDGEAAGDKSGVSVSLSSDGNIVAIGASLNGDNGFAAGHVRVFAWTDESSSWVKRGDDIDGEALYEFSGIKVSLSSDGNIVAIGGYKYASNFLSNTGRVRVYGWTDSNSSWVQLGGDIDGEAAEGATFISISLSSDGTIVAMGVPGNDGNGTDAGHTRVHAWTNGSSWVQLGDDIDGEAAEDNSGFSVSLSSDGTVVAIGAVKNAGNGTAAGHVRVYVWEDNSSWVLRGNDIDGETSSFSGSSTSLSSDGSIVAIGAPYTIEGGHVRVFKFNLPGGGGFGDPHFKLINGNYMSYHGQCDILLSRIDSFASGLGLEIHIRTTRVDRSINAYSYISGAAVRIGSDVVEVLESGMLLINGDDADMQLINEEEGRGYPAMTHTSLLISGFKIKSSAKGTHRRIFIHDLDLGNRNSIQIRANNLTGMLSVDLVGEEFGNSVGLLSGKIAAHPAANAYNQDTLLGRGEDGLLMTDSVGYWNSCAESWQIKGTDHKLFHDTNRFPQYPVGCVYNKKKLRRRLLDSSGDDSIVSLEVAMNLCAGKVAKKREYCIFDIMATGDLELVDDPSYN